MKCYNIYEERTYEHEHYNLGWITRIIDQTINNRSYCIHNYKTGQTIVLKHFIYYQKVKKFIIVQNACQIMNYFIIKI